MHILIHLIHFLCILNIYLKENDSLKYKSIKYKQIAYGKNTKHLKYLKENKPIKAWSKINNSFKMISLWFLLINKSKKSLIAIIVPRK